MSTLETRIPPPIVMALLGGLAWAAAHFLPELSFLLPFSRSTGALVVALGLALNIFPKLAFRRVGTTVNPMRPSSTTHLVTSGIYRYSRNPMYLGHSVVLLGWAVLLHNFIAFLVVPGFVFYISRFQIQPEERYLSARFKDEYASFRERAPRWL